MARQKPMYSVSITAYASWEVKEQVGRGEEAFVEQQFTTESVYFGESEARAGTAFMRALRRTRKNPLAVFVTVWQDLEVIVRVQVKP